MALPTIATALSIASLTMLSFCGWGPGGNGGGGGGPIPPGPGPDTFRFDTGDIDVDTDTDLDTDSDSDTDADTALPSRDVVVSSVLATEVAVSESNTCVISAGVVQCWGDDRFGMVSDVPTASVRDLDLGWDVGCALDISNAIVCWGDDTFGLVSASPVGPFTQVTTGTLHACALDAGGTPTCWGSDSFGKATAPIGPFIDISAGDQHTCALSADGSRTCWGDTGAWSASLVGPFNTVDAGASRTCMGDDRGVFPAFQCSATATPTNAEAYDTGRGATTCYVQGGQALCIGGPDGPAPQEDDPFFDVAAGFTHHCARAESSQITCWGYSERGALDLPTDDGVVDD